MITWDDKQQGRMYIDIGQGSIGAGCKLVIKAEAGGVTVNVVRDDAVAADSVGHTKIYASDNGFSGLNAIGNV